MLKVYLIVKFLFLLLAHFFLGVTSNNPTATANQIKPITATHFLQLNTTND